MSSTMTDGAVWQLLVMLELECLVYQLLLYGTTFSQAEVRERIPRAFANIEK
jgi:hypothetical protein